MMSLSVLVEILVIGLLALTIGYCALLNRQLSRLRADESTLKSTIRELGAATGMAERAIISLRSTAQECDVALSRQLSDSHKIIESLRREIDTGEMVFTKIARIARAARQSGAEIETNHSPKVKSPLLRNFESNPTAAEHNRLSNRRSDGKVKPAAIAANGQINIATSAESRPQSTTPKNALLEHEASTNSPDNNKQDLSTAAREVVERLQAMRRQTNENAA